MNACLRQPSLFKYHEINPSSIGSGLGSGSQANCPPQHRKHTHIHTHITFTRFSIGRFLHLWSWCPRMDSTRYIWLWRGKASYHVLLCLIMLCSAESPEAGLCRFLFCRKDKACNPDHPRLAPSFVGVRYRLPTKVAYQ